MYIHDHINTHTHSTLLHIFTHTNMHIHMYTLINTHTRLHIHTYTLTYTFIYTHTFTHTLIHTHKHKIVSICNTALRVLMQCHYKHRMRSGNPDLWKCAVKTEGRWKDGGYEERPTRGKERKQTREESEERKEGVVNI